MTPPVTQGTFTPDSIIINGAVSIDAVSHCEYTRTTTTDGFICGQVDVHCGGIEGAAVSLITKSYAENATIQLRFEGNVVGCLGSEISGLIVAYGYCEALPEFADSEFWFWVQFSGLA
jgi:hypothetical protein